MQALALQPLYGSDAAQMVPMLLGNFSDVAAALQQAATELRSGNQQILQSLTGKRELPTALCVAMHNLWAHINALGVIK